ncbi:MAG TPA: protein translocase subunit SecF [Gemmatimonadaceae bacterium]|nr:protein translocase subunit SecF [Gemmatimonadaceae bacterium]
MLRIFHNTRFDFIRLRHWTYALSALIIVPGLIWIAFSGFRQSIEFTGGTLIQVHFTQTPDIGNLRATLDGAGIHGAEIQQFGTPNDVIIRAQGAAQVAEQAQSSSVVAHQITAALDQRYQPSTFNVVRSETVGPKVGGELRQKAALAILASFVITLIYLAIRFEWRFGVAAVVATAHDILATLAFIKYTHLEISLVVVGAILTMIGYSLNDTIVIFDRVREDLRQHRKETFYDTLNRAVNETLPRSVMTHATTFATLLGLTLLGGEVIRPFALVMLFGVFTGTFSSVYVASPILLWIETRWPRAASDKGGVGPRSARQSERPRAKDAKAVATR